MAARLKVDENLPDEIADVVVRYGYDAVTAADQGWRGIADDQLLQRIQDEDRWLVTADKRLVDYRYRPPGTHAGIILFRSSGEGLDAYLALVQRVIDGVDLDDAAGAIIVVNDRGVRARRAS